MRAAAIYRFYYCSVNSGQAQPLLQYSRHKTAHKNAAYRAEL